MVERAQWHSGTISLAPARVLARDVLGGVFDQFALNFLLNDGDGSPELVASVEHTTESFAVAGHAPRRRRDEVEQIHQCRVALRRLRSWVRVFARQCPPGGVELGHDLAWYADALGSVRDLGVLEAALAPTMANAGSDVAGFVTARLAAARDEALVRLGRERRDPRHASLSSRIADLGEETRRLGSDEAADEALPRGLWATWGDVGVAATAARAEDSSHTRHRLRIRLKRLQYAGEVAAIRDERAVTVARRAERLQTRLGSSHDHAVAAEWVQRQMVIVPRLRSGLAELAYGQRVLEADTATEWRRDLDRLGREVARTRRAV